MYVLLLKRAAVENTVKLIDDWKAAAAATAARRGRPFILDGNFAGAS